MTALDQSPGGVRCLAYALFSHGTIAFAMSELVQLHMLDMGETRQTQRVSGAVERTSVNHDNSPRRFTFRHERLHAAANPGKARHFADTVTIELPTDTIGQFTRVGTSRARVNHRRRRAAPDASGVRIFLRTVGNQSHLSSLATKARRDSLDAPSTMCGLIGIRGPGGGQSRSASSARRPGDNFTPPSMSAPG